MNKTYNIFITFIENDPTDNNLFQITVPSTVSKFDINRIIRTEHTILDEDPEQTIYGSGGRNPETLLDFICQKYNWSYKPLQKDLSISLL